MGNGQEMRLEKFGRQTRGRKWASGVKITNRFSGAVGRDGICMRRRANASNLVC